MTCQVFGPCLVQKSTSVELRSTQPRPSKHLSTDQLPSDSSHRFLFRMMLEVRDSSFVSNVLAGTFLEIKSKMSLRILLTVTFASFQNYLKYKKFPLKIK